MKVPLLVFGLLAAVALVPAATASHTIKCSATDVDCMAFCVLNTFVGHECAIENERLLDRCPSGEGVVVYVDGNPVPVCV